MPPKNTGAILQQLRVAMKSMKGTNESLAAYIIPSTDAHMSEYIASCDKRREFVSGFSGSAGTAIVTHDKAALWTDGRYYLQALNELDSNWTLMKDGQPDTPSQSKWLCNELTRGNKVGVDPFLISVNTWRTLSKDLIKSGLELLPVHHNLVDTIWTDRPTRPASTIKVHTQQYAGLPWEEKVRKIRMALLEKGADLLVVTALDEIAWLLNLRGQDIEFNPVFFAYIILTKDTVFFFLDERELTDDCLQHLNLRNTLASIICLKTYNKMLEELATLVNVPDQPKVWVASNASHAILSIIPEAQQIVEPTPIALMKATKNESEIEGMKKAHVKDAVALCEYFAWLEAEIKKSKLYELDGSKKLLECRHGQENFVSPSFETISAVGPNAAIIHYRPSQESNHIISPDWIYLCDSGGHYLDGTTDVTRTIHFGKPSRYQQECFTRVLKGHIQLMTAVFPNGTKGSRLDSLARLALWEKGFDYLHGTGHGVGSFLNVHEGPCMIGYRVNTEESNLVEGMVLSNEPGYYEDKAFGIRIESLMLVVKAQTLYNFKEKGFLTFEPLTLVPIQTKLIIPELLTATEMAWINSYHNKCREVIGPELLRQGKKDGYYWLLRETQHVGLPDDKDNYRSPPQKMRRPNIPEHKFM